ncbi:MAG: ATP-binding protein [Patulibacter minatonensis]
MSSSRLGRQVGRYLAAAVAVAASAFVVLGLTVLSLERTNDSARDHQRLAELSQRVGALVVDAETAVRGFAITERQRFLDPLDEAQNQLPTVTTELEESARSEAERERARRVAALADAYLNTYALPTAETAREDPDSARSRVTSEEGKQRVDQVRREVSELADLAGRTAARDRDASRSRAALALVVTVLAALTFIGTLILLVRALRRRVVAPLSTITDAALRIGAGDLAARVHVRGSEEVVDLSTALNTMAAQLQESHDEVEAQHTELESQNAELEAQSVELEAQAVELERRSAAVTATNAALEERGRQLEETARQLEISGERLQLFASVAESLAQVPDVEARAARLLDELADAADCAIGAIYVRTPGATADRLPLAARRGLRGAPAHADEAGDAAERAVRERRTIVVTHPHSTLEYESLGGRTAVRHEVHLPLLAGSGRDELLGVLSLARTHDAPFDGDDLQVIEHLADTSALALFNAFVSAQREREAAMMRSVLDSVSEAILVVTTTGEIILSNPPMDAFARRLIGLGSDEPWTVPQMREALGEHVADRSRHEDGVEKFARDEFATDAQIIELPRLGIWVHRYAGPVSGPNDELLGRIAVVRDITEERQAERAKDDLMATVSHELRTPLAAILGFTELLVTREFPEAERAEYLDTAYQQSVRLSELLDDFLDLQRIERRGLDHRSAVDVRELVDDQVNLYSAQSDEHQLDAAVGDEPLLVEADGERLRRVIGNLLSNAIKYSPEGGAVHVHATQNDGVVRLEVSDRGIGIPHELRERVFDRFFRVDSGATARIGGTGLGLALVRDIIAAHGGQVGVDSVEGQGSKFWFTLPAVRG